MSKWTTYAGITEVTSLPIMERIPLIINKVIPEMTPFIDRIDRNVFGDKENSIMVSFKTGDDFTRPFATLNDSVTLFGDVRISWDTYTAKVKYGTLPEEEQRLLKDAWLYLAMLNSGIHNFAIKRKDVMAGILMSMAACYLADALSEFASFKQSEVATIKYLGELQDEDLYTEVVNYIINNVKYSVTGYHFKCNGNYCLQADALLTEFIHYADNDAVDEAIYSRYGTLPTDEHKRISRMVKAILLVKCLDDEYIEPKVKEELSAIVSKYNLNETKQDIVNIANRAYDNLEHAMW